MSPHVRAHGGVAIDKDYCTFRASGYTFHFTAYQPETLAGKELCKTVPSTEEAVLVLDFVDEALRKIPIRVSIEKEQETDYVSIQSMPAQLYPSGSMFVPFLKPTEGKYKVIIDLESENVTEHVENHPSAATFSFAVSDAGPGESDSFYKQNSWLILILILGILLGLIAKKLSKS